LIRDLEQEQPDPADRAGICIVGAGAAGIVLAVELARLGRQVTLLEGGGATIEDASQDPYRSELAGLPHRGVHIGRFRAYGGTTTQWGGQILELDEIDFTKRDWVQGSGWPIPKSELSSGYARALELQGVGAAILDDAEVWTRLGLVKPTFEHMISHLTRWCPEPNFAVLHAKVLEGPAVSLWLHTNAVELDMDGDLVRSVRCRTLGGKQATFCADRFVFCLGTIESSRFFLQPRQGGLPWNRSGLLGKHFQDHIDASSAVVTPRDRRRFHQIFDGIFLNGYKYLPKLKVDVTTMRESETLNAGATIAAHSDIDDQLIAIKTTVKKILRGGMRGLSKSEVLGVFRHPHAVARLAWRYKVAHRAFIPRDAKLMLRVHSEQEPLSASSISLSDQRDSLGLLRTRLDWRVSELELKTIRKFTLIAKQELSAIAELTLDPDLERGDPAFIQRCDDGYHQMGGMRMAATECDGVVDTNLRLAGTKNCYVCSAAVFPTSGFSNPTHTLLALAVRLAGHLDKG
jgi:choline dehydrogenase-like flavoprotein